MPAGTSPSPGGIPRGTGRFVLRLRRLPQREILSVLLRVIILNHARSSSDLASIQTRELAVILELVDREVDAAVVSEIREATFNESLDDGEHFGDVVRR